MTWGTDTNVTTDHLDSATDDPSQARVELYNALLELQLVIQGRGAASGVAPLNASTKIDNTYLPDTISSSVSTDLTVSPATSRTVFEDIIALTPKSVAELELLTANAGDIAYCTDGDGGLPCIAVCTGDSDSVGTIWYRISLGAQILTTS